MMASDKTVFIALGSNLDDPTHQLSSAICAIKGLPNSTVVHVSSFYQTAPIGYDDQDDFINAVILLRTGLDKHSLLDALQAIENQQGRIRSFQNAPRTLDLDIIDYNLEDYQDKRLSLPHPRAYMRAFVVVPLAEIAPDFEFKGHGKARDLAPMLSQTQKLQKCPNQA